MLERIIELTAENLGADAATITAETSFKDDLHADSLDLFELAMAFEEEFSVEIPSEDPVIGNAVSHADKELLDKAIEIIKNNFENQDFNMNVLAAELAIGRNKLYARIRELTGMTPNEFVLKLKLDESIELLNNHPELNISEISDRLGFSSTPYFTKCFKSIYGIAPLNYRKRD